MFFIFFLNLSVLINLSWGQTPELVHTPVPSGVTSCTKFRLPAGCTCDDSSGGAAKINCSCLEVYKKTVYFSNTFIKYNHKRECLIDFFPGCQPVVLPEGVSQPCEKLKRIVPKLTPVLRADDYARFCSDDLNQKVELMSEPGSIKLNCFKVGEGHLAQVHFLP